MAHENFQVEVFDNVIVRKLIDCVKVLSKRITDRFQGRRGSKSTDGKITKYQEKLALQVVFMEMRIVRV
ncbi:MAG: hypothetical protein ACLVK8_04950 [Ruminococcus sp.]